jgi:plasmid replication initiation protein
MGDFTAETMAETGTAVQAATHAGIGYLVRVSMTHHAPDRMMAACCFFIHTHTTRQQRERREAGTYMSSKYSSQSTGLGESPKIG